MSLKKRTLRAITITLAGHGTQQVIRFGGNLVTTRLLAPDLFGAMLIANSLYTLVMLLTDMGLTLSVIRNKDGENPSFLKTVFSLKALQGLFLFSLILIIALFIVFANNFQLIPPESALAHKDLPAALSIVAFAALINGFQSIQIDLQHRYQTLAKLTSLALAAQLFSVLFVITSAYQNPTIHSLAFANVVSSLTTCIGSYLVFDRKHAGFDWNIIHVRNVFSFGKWITASSILVGITKSTDKFLFGFILTGTQMGLYAIASLISIAIASVFEKVNNSFFPALSEVIRDQPDRVSEIYYRIRLYRDVLTCFPSCILITNGDLLINFLYDERYSGAGVYLQFLAIAPLVDTFMLKDKVITAGGNSKIQFQTAIWRFFGMLFTIPLGFYFFGLVGALSALALRRLFGSWLLFIEFEKLGYLRLLKEIRTFLIIVLCLTVGYFTRIVAIQLGFGAE